MTPNMTAPISRSPRITKLANASITRPASASARIRRVVATLSASRHRVKSNTKVGNARKSAVRRTRIVATSSTTAAARFEDSSRSTIAGGIGTSRQTSSAITISPGATPGSSRPSERKPRRKPGGEEPIDVRATLAHASSDAPPAHVFAGRPWPKDRLGGAGS